jgi:hypothetical protein
LTTATTRRAVKDMGLARSNILNCRERPKEDIDR